MVEPWIPSGLGSSTRRTKTASTRLVSMAGRRGWARAPPCPCSFPLPLSLDSLCLSPSSFLFPDRSREQHQSHHAAAHGGPSVDPFTTDVHVDLVTSYAAASHVQSGAAMCEARTTAAASSLTLVHANVGQPTPMPPAGPDPMRPADGQRGSGQWWSHRSRRCPM